MMTISESKNWLTVRIRAIWRWTSANCFSGSVDVRRQCSSHASLGKKNKHPELATHLCSP
jgi:hypothetical protein